MGVAKLFKDKRKGRGGEELRVHEGEFWVGMKWVLFLEDF